LIRCVAAWMKMARGVLETLMEIMSSRARNAENSKRVGDRDNGNREVRKPGSSNVARKTKVRSQVNPKAAANPGKGLPRVVSMEETAWTIVNSRRSCVNDCVKPKRYDATGAQQVGPSEGSAISSSN
jgi:hypothetical protein